MFLYKSRTDFLIARFLVMFGALYCIHTAQQTATPITTTTATVSTSTHQGWAV